MESSGWRILLLSERDVADQTTLGKQISTVLGWGYPIVVLRQLKPCEPM